MVGIQGGKEDPFEERVLRFAQAASPIKDITQSYRKFT